MHQPHLLNITLACALLCTSLLVGAQPTDAAGIPAQAYISGLVGHAQSYALSCESRSAADLAAFWGVSVSETKFLNSLPRSDNPNKGFVGDVNDPWGYVPPRSYGVHAKPVAKQLRKLGLDADAKRGMSWKDLRAEIAAGRPAIVWVIGGVWSGTAQVYKAKDGEKTIVAAYEHTMIAIGYDQSVVHLVDAGSGRIYTVSVSAFRNSWGVLDNMAVTVKGDKGQQADQKEESDKKNSDASENQNSGQSYTVQVGDYLAKVARNFGMSWVELAALNNITYPYVIYAGQVLQLSGSAAAAEAEPEPEPEEAPQEETQPQQQTSGGSYTVQRGEHLMQIARERGLDWRAIADLNALSPPYTLYPGQVLQLPGGASVPAPKKEKQETEPEKPSGETYTVKKGDYLVALARKWGINWQTLAALNGISYPYVVHPGQVLKLP